MKDAIQRVLVKPSRVFSFDDPALISMNSEYLNVNALNLNFHSHAYTQADAAAAAATEVSFMDGAFLGLSFAPVPVSATFAMLLAGLGLFGLSTRKCN